MCASLTHGVTESKATLLQLDFYKTIVLFLTLCKINKTNLVTDKNFIGNTGLTQVSPPFTRNITGCGCYDLACCKHSAD